MTFLLQAPLLELDEVAEDEAPLTPEDARRISHEYKLLCDDRTDKWASDYQTLLGGGWDWRVAVFIAWKSMPPDLRQPATQEQLAKQVLGLRSDRVIRKWCEKNPAIEETIAKLPMQTMLARRRAVDEALMESATTQGHKHSPDRRLFYQVTGLLAPDGTQINNVTTQVNSDEMSKAKEKAKAFEAQIVDGGVAPDDARHSA